MTRYRVSLVYRPPGEPDPVTGDQPSLEEVVEDITSSTPRDAALDALHLHSGEHPFTIVVVVQVDPQPTGQDEWWFDVDDLRD